jgi:adenylate cyclase
VEELNQGSAWLEAATGVRTPIQGTCFLGRSNTNHIVLADDRVSRRHAVVHVQGQDEFWLIDLGSSNGTYLNGRRISQPCRLAEGDRVELANHAFSFRHPRSQRPALPTRTGTEKTIQEIKAVNCWLLVADMESSTQFIKATAPEESLRVTGRWLSACKQIVEDRGGTINKFLGDGFLAFWRDQENTPASVGKALEALRHLQDQAQPRFRIVLHFGKVYIGGTASLGEESLLGNDVNFAFRMEKMAGSLGAPRVMSEPAQQRLHGLLPTSKEGRRALSGFDGEFDFFSF